MEPWWNLGATLVEPYLRAAPDHPARPPTEPDGTDFATGPDLAPAHVRRLGRAQLRAQLPAHRGRAEAQAVGLEVGDPLGQHLAPSENRRSLFDGLGLGPRNISSIS